MFTSRLHQKVNEPYGVCAAGVLVRRWRRLSHRLLLYVVSARGFN